MIAKSTIVKLSTIMEYYVTILAMSMKQCYGYFSFNATILFLIQKGLLNLSQY